MLILFQLLFSLFALFAIISVWSKKRVGLLSVGGTVFWIIFWLLAVVFVWWPDSTVKLANFLGIGRGSDLVLYVSLVVIFYLLFRLGVRLESINRDITKIVRDKTLNSKS
jgi:hypothetical protein